MTHPFRSQLVPVLLITAVFFLNFTARIILAPLMPTIETQLGIRHTQAGALFFFLSCGYFFSLLSTNFITCWLTHRQTILLSAFGVGATLLGFCFVQTFHQLCLGFVILGVTAGLYLPSGIATLTALIQQQHWGKGLAVHELAPNLGFVTAPLIAEFLIRWLTWQEILAVVGIASLLTGIAFALFGKGGRFSGQPPRLLSFQQILCNSRFWIMAVLFGLAIGSSMGVYAVLPLYLVAERGLDRDWTNTIIAVSRISGLVMGFVSGWATDRFSAPLVMAAVLLLSGLFTAMLGLAPDHAIVGMVFLQPMIAVCFFPAGFAVLSSMAPAGSRNVVVALTVPLGFLIGGGVIPAVVGWMGDTSTLAFGLTLVGCLIFAGFVLSLFLTAGKNTTAYNNH
jgi:MFS transporter, NNP family, nitrate/nitrite transporter